ncbi:MAG: tetratricopeptide repeat protein [Alistipes sp.]|nr:tetratricopeptide repeat protein [Alistipes sp.]
MRRLSVLLLLCALFSTGLLPRTEAASPPDGEWPDSLRAAERYTEGLKRLLVAGDTLAARGLFREALASDSAYAPAWFRLGSVAERGDSALVWAERAYRLDSMNKWYVRLYAERLLDRGVYDRTRQLFVRLTRLDPADPDNFRILAILYGQAGMPYSAIDVLDSAEMRFGRNPLLSEMKRRLLLGTGQTDRALGEARAAVEEAPYEIVNHLVLAELCGQTGHDSLALAAYRRALAMDSTSVPVLASLAEFYNRRNRSADYLEVSRRLFDSEELPLGEKLRIFRQLTLDSRFYRDNFFQLNSLVTLLSIRYPDDPQVVECYATHLLRAGELEQALAYYKHHLGDVPAQKEYYRSVIDMESYLKRLDSVYRYVDLAVRAFPDEPAFHLSRGHAEAYAGQLRQAIASYRRALRRTTTDSLRGAVWGHIGDAYHQMETEARRAGRAASLRRKCFAAYDRSLAARYDHAPVLNNYAYFLGEKSDDRQELERALAMARRAVELTDNNATYLDTYGWVLFRLGRLEEARRTMRQAIAFDRDESPELYFHYGEVLAALGEKFMAETYWRKALEGGYDEPEVLVERIRRLKENP